MNIDKIKEYLPYVWTGLPGVMAVVVIIFGLCNGHQVTKVFLLLLSAVLFSLCVLLYLYYFILGEGRKNYFLTDPDTGKNIRPNMLTFEIVNDRMNLYLATRIKDENELWTGGFLSKRGVFGQRDIFKPMTVYKMLFDLSQHNGTDGWQKFFAMSDPDFARMINCLDMVNDVNMSRRLTSIRRLTEPARGQIIADFITKNQKYIQNRMLSFVKSHLSDFDEKSTVI